MSSSIRARLLIQLLAVLGLFVVAAYAVTRTIALNTLQNSQDQALISVAQVISDSVVATPDQILFELPYAAFDVLSYQAPESIFYQVRQGDTPLAGYSDLPLLQQPSQTRRYLGQPVRFVQLEKPLTDTSVWITLGQTQDSLTQQASALAARSAVYAIIGFLLIAAAAYAGVMNGLSPLRAIERNLKRRNPEDFEPIDEVTPKEIETLVESLNHSMQGHKELLDQTRGLIAKSTHQIKTPLASLSAEADLLRERAPESLRDDIGNLAIHARRTSRLVSQLLTHASLTYRRGFNRHQSTAIQPLLQQIVEGFEIIAERSDAAITLNCPAGLTHQIDPIGVREAIVCLIENALKYAGELAEIQIDVIKDSRLEIRVSDNGPGFSGPLDRLTEEFYSQHASPGLGLSIVQQVAHAGDGELVLSNQENGGAQCQLFLP